MKNIKEIHAVLNRLCKATDELYHNYAAGIGLSDSALWIFYAICESDGSLTQNELCTLWCYSKQTVNSTVKSLCDKGLLFLEHIDGTRTHKAIRLTNEGRQFCDKYILPLIKAEQDVYSTMTDRQIEEYVSVKEKEYSLLKDKFSEIEARRAQ